MEILSERLIINLSPECVRELERAAKAGDLSRQDVIRAVLDAARPHLGDLAKVFKAAKDQQQEALHHVLLGMAGAASMQTGKLLTEMSHQQAKGGKRGAKST